MLPSDIRSLREAYQSIYSSKEEIVESVEDTVELTEEILDEAFNELIEELIEEGYEEDEAISLVEEATDSYIDEAKVTFGSDTAPMRASGAPVGARRRYGMRKAGEALQKAGSAAKGAVDSAKGAYKTAKAVGGIAGSIAKDEARRAGRAAKQAVTSAPGKAKAAVEKKKQETKRGIKGFIKRQAEKVVKRMSEELQALQASGKFTEAEIAAFVSVEEGYKEIDTKKHGRMYDRYKKLRSAAMQDARDSGEASGDNRMKMGKMSSVLDKSAENLRKKQTKDQLTGRG